jgi:hypothetical protein
MDIEKIEAGGTSVAIIRGSGIVIEDVQSALDLMATVRFETGCDRMVIGKSLICEDFFNLKTRLAGDILQKFVNYQVKLAIAGDFSQYSSQSLQDFMRECNKGKDIFFLPDEQTAIEKLSVSN